MRDAARARGRVVVVARAIRIAAQHIVVVAKIVLAGGLLRAVRFAWIAAASVAIAVAPFAALIATLSLFVALLAATLSLLAAAVLRLPLLLLIPLL